jgi:hypothetical protein
MAAEMRAAGTMAGVLPESAARRKSGGFSRLHRRRASKEPVLGDSISASCDFKTLGAFFCNGARQVMIANASGKLRAGREFRGRHKNRPRGLPDSRVRGNDTGCPLGHLAFRTYSNSASPAPTRLRRTTCSQTSTISFYQKEVSETSSADELAFDAPRPGAVLCQPREANLLLVNLTWPRAVPAGPWRRLWRGAVVRRNYRAQS